MAGAAAGPPSLLLGATASRRTNGEELWGFFVRLRGGKPRAAVVWRLGLPLVAADAPFYLWLLAAVARAEIAALLCGEVRSF